MHTLSKVHTHQTGSSITVPQKAPKKKQRYKQLGRQPIPHLILLLDASTMKLCQTECYLLQIQNTYILPDHELKSPLQTKIDKAIDNSYARCPTSTSTLSLFRILHTLRQLAPER